MGEGRVSKWCSAGSASLRRELGSLGDFCLLCLVSLTTSQFEFWPFTWQKWLSEEEGIKLLQPRGEILSQTACELILPIQLEHRHIYHPAPGSPDIPSVVASSWDWSKEKLPTLSHHPLLAFYSFHKDDGWQWERNMPGIPFKNCTTAFPRDVQQCL